jgi:hypothetical protein
MRLYVSAIIVAALSFLFVSEAMAHGGGLDRNGCHHNRKDGSYHCHRKP